MLAALLSRYRHLKQSFFSLITFWTSSFHHQVSLASLLLPLVTPNSSTATFRKQVAILVHIMFASPPSSQGPSLITLSLKARDASPLSFHHFVLATLARLPCWTRILERKSATTSLC